MELLILAAIAAGLYYVTKDDKGGSTDELTSSWQVATNSKPLGPDAIDNYAVLAAKGDKIAVRFALQHKVAGGTVTVMALGDIVKQTPLDYSKEKASYEWDVSFSMFDPDSLKGAELKLLTDAKAAMPAAPAKGTIFKLRDSNLF